MSSLQTVKASALFRRHAQADPGVEVWLDEGFDEGGWSYAWIVSRCSDGPVRNREYVRFRGAQLQRRTYDEAGDDRWVEAE